MTVLGPFARAVLWVQGCPRSCPGCIAPESQPADGGELLPVADVERWLRSCPDIEGVTVSGGEPFAQAESLCELIRSMRDTGLGWMCYTGFLYEWLRDEGSPAQRRLVSLVDLLVDGPYLQERHADLLWRGSGNQRLLAISDRYRNLVQSLTGETDRSAGLEIRIDERGEARFTGVPAERGFRDSFG